jgi:hypothetical protein
LLASLRNCDWQYFLKISRFIYSHEKLPLQSISFAKAVFKFSFIWDIEQLTAMLFKFFKFRSSDATDTLAVLDLYVELGLKEEQKWCCQVSRGSSEIFLSQLKIWISVPGA